MQDNTIDVLDHGFVRLVDHMGDDMSVVRAARVSYAAAQRTGEDAGKDEKLIRYLMKNRHTSPFEAVTMTFNVRAPLFVLRQWHRHRTWSYNEESARYTELKELYYLPDPKDVTAQSSSNKQMRTDVPILHASEFVAELGFHSRASFQMYRDALAKGVPRELARCFLPLNTYSEMFATVNLLNLYRFLELRLHEHAQYEIRCYARAMLEFAEMLVPVSTNAFKAYWLGDFDG